MSLGAAHSVQQRVALLVMSSMVVTYMVVTSMGLTYYDKLDMVVTWMVVIYMGGNGSKTSGRWW